MDQKVIGLCCPTGNIWSSKVVRSSNDSDLEGSFVLLRKEWVSIASSLGCFDIDKRNSVRLYMFPIHIALIHKSIKNDRLREI
jgi:hypothetical protein